jgi:hypothetical protein
MTVEDWRRSGEKGICDGLRLMNGECRARIRKWKAGNKYYSLPKWALSIICHLGPDPGSHQIEITIEPSRDMETETNREKMNMVIVGHVDHGKSTIIGRLLADTHSMPDGKLDQVRSNCERNSKPFEYAFLIDALKDEQTQGITIESARVFLKRKTPLSDHGCPRHIEFLKIW